MEYNWTTSVFIAASELGVGIVLLIVLVVIGTAVGLGLWADDGDPKEDGDPTESSQNDANQLLRQIEANTAKTAFWTKVVGVPVLIGLIIGALASMAQCS
jgi:hypothetical protein